MTHAMTRCVGARVDWLTLAWQGPIPDAIRTLLERRGAEAARHGCAVELRAPDGWRGALAPSRRADWWRLESADGVAVIDAEAAGAWCVVVEQSGEHLHARTLANAYAAAQRVAAALYDGAVPERCRVRRVDLAADMSGFPLDDVTADAWLTRRRAMVGRFDAADPVRTYTQGRHVTGFVIAPGNFVMARIYDKRAQLAALHDADRADAELERWTAAGWTDEPVARVEYQLRGDALAEIGDPPLRDRPETLAAQLDAVWAYLSTRWLQLVDLASASRRTRCALDSRWEAVQTVRFDRDAAPAPRARRPGRAAAAQAVGCALSAQADAAALVEPPGDSEVAGMTEPGAALYAHGLVHGAMAQTAEDYLAALLARHAGDARAVAAYLAAKVAGIRASR